MIFKRTLSAIIALTMTTGIAAGCSVDRKTGSSNNEAKSVTSGDLTIDNNNTDKTETDVHDDKNSAPEQNIGEDSENFSAINTEENETESDVHDDGKLPDDDKKSAPEQHIGEDSYIFSAINTEDNAFSVSIDITAEGDAQVLLSADESGYSNVINSDMVVGAVLEFEYEEGYAVDEVTLNFNIKDDYIENTDGEYAAVSEDFKGIKRYNVFKYFEDIDMLLPIETNYDTESNTVTTTVDELGTYCLVDMEKWFKILGVDPTELSSSSS